MARRFVSFNLWQPASEDWAYESNAQDTAMRARWTDTHTWGILRNNEYPAVLDIPVSNINPVPPRYPNILSAPVTLDMATGHVTVGAGSNSATNPKIAGAVAYDLYGQRIAITDDEPFDFSNDSPYGKKSSGNLGISLNLSGTSGDCFAFPSEQGTYYLWIEYLEVNDPTPVSGEDGVVHYPQVWDGYRIIVTADPIPPSGDAVSIFLAKVTWLGGAGTLTATNGNDIDGGGSGSSVETIPTVVGDPHRVWAGKRPMHVEIVIDEANKLTTRNGGLGIGYGDGFIGSLDDHVMGIGSGAATDRNPHGLALEDIPDAGEEPTAINNQFASLAEGIVDKNAPQNSPAYLGDAGQPFIELTALAPFATLDGAAVAAGITSTVKAQWVRILDFDKGPPGLLKEAFSLGFGLLKLYPTLRVTNLAGDASVTPDPDSGDGWVGFNNAEDAAGYWMIYGEKVVLDDGTDALLLNKLGPQISPHFDMDTFANIGRLPLAVTYWDGIELFRNEVQPSSADPTDVKSATIDRRSLGLVGPKQIFTEAKSDPDKGMLSAQVMENQAANSNYSLGLLNITEDNMGVAEVLDNSIPITAGTDPSMASSGPAAVTGRQWPVNAGVVATLGTSNIFHLLKNLKPGRLYGLSFSYKVPAGFKARLRLGLADNNATGFNTLTTLDGATPVDPIDYTLRNDNQWHRGSMILQTLADASAVNPDPVNLKYLVFQLQQGGIDTLASELNLTNVQLTEGEWVPGYMGSKYVPSGGIIMWDKTTSCPAGYQPIAEAEGRFPVGVGVNGLVPEDQSAAQLNPGGGGATTGLAGSHNHSYDLNDFNGVGQDGLGANAPDRATGPNAPGSNTSVVAAHTHSMDSGLPYYGVILCRAI